MPSQLKDTDYFLGKSRLILKEGRLPREGEDRIAIHEQIAVARGVGMLGNHCLRDV